jgi:hypothetical protein
MNSDIRQSPVNPVSNRSGVQAAYDHPIDKMTENDGRRPSPADTETEQSRPGDLTTKNEGMHQGHLRQHDKTGEHNRD